MFIINDGKELNRIIFLILIFLFGCDSIQDNINAPKIEVSPVAIKRAQELVNNNFVIAAEIYNDPSTIRGSDKNFVYLDPLQTGIDFKNI